MPFLYFTSVLHQRPILTSLILFL